MFIFHSVLPSVLVKVATVLNPSSLPVGRDHTDGAWPCAGLFL